MCLTSMSKPNRKLPDDERCMGTNFEYILELQAEKELS
ncbi:hypothetical protein CLOBL_13680 [Clostridium sp. BL-8]|nr:hypothetical protein CLOBL_13680 [Clostridium sp. BL-8]